MIGWIRGEFWDGRIASAPGDHQYTELEEALFATVLYTVLISEINAANGRDDIPATDTNKDGFYDIDKEFGEAFRVVAECAVNADRPVTAQVEDAADRMFDLAIQQADPTMLSAAITAGFSRFVEDGRAPPSTALEHIKDGFARWASGSHSMDAAFCMKQDKRGKRSVWATRARKRAGVVLMEMVREEGISIPKAAERLEDATGARDMERAYNIYAMKVKGINSE